MTDLWLGLPAGVQDAALAALFLLPLVLTGALCLRGFAPWPLLGALLARYRWTNAAFVLLIAVSVGMGIGLTAQERALRRATAQAADGFDLVVAAPGSEMAMLLATVFLQPTNAPLLDGATYADIAAREGVALAAPLAFGDSVDGAPVVGTTAAFVTHLSGPLAEGRAWAAPLEAVVGADVPATVGAELHPAHGTGEGADHEAHEDDITVVGRMARTGSPWDRAVVVPIEGVWAVHGLASGHAPGTDRLGPPFDPAYFPGTPAIVLRAEGLSAAYGLQSALTGAGETMAFFPGAVLSGLYRVMGDVRQAMSLMTLVAQVLVAASVLTGLFILTRLFRRQLALLRAIGAPGRFVLAVVWGYAAVLLSAGALLGLPLGWGAAMALGEVVSQRTGLMVRAVPGWPELHLVAGFLGIAGVVALWPALAVLRRPVLAGLRS